jgi:hypothetical protein
MTSPAFMNQAAGRRRAWKARANARQADGGRNTPRMRVAQISRSNGPSQTAGRKSPEGAYHARGG